MYSSPQPTYSKKDSEGTPRGSERLSAVLSPYHLWEKQGWGWSVAGLPRFCHLWPNPITLSSSLISRGKPSGLTLYLVYDFIANVGNKANNTKPTFLQFLNKAFGLAECGQSSFLRSYRWLRSDEGGNKSLGPISSMDTSGCFKKIARLRRPSLS